MRHVLKIRIVRCDDWQWVYLDGEVCDIEGGHEVEHERMAAYINDYLKNMGDKPIGKIDCETLWITEEYAEEGVPQFLKDIPNEVFS